MLTTEAVVSSATHRVREAVRLNVPLLHASFAAAYVEGAVTNLSPWVIPPPVRRLWVSVYL